MAGARGLLINITGGEDMTLFEVDQAANRIREEVDEEANIIFGSAIDETLTGKIRVSVVATGIDTPVQKTAERPRLVAVGGGGGMAQATASSSAGANGASLGVVAAPPMAMRPSGSALQPQASMGMAPQAMGNLAPQAVGGFAPQARTQPGRQAPIGAPLPRMVPSAPMPAAAPNQQALESDYGVDGTDPDEQADAQPAPRATVYPGARPQQGRPNGRYGDELPAEAAQPARKSLFGIVTGAIRGSLPATQAGAPAQPVRAEPSMHEAMHEAPVRANVRQTAGEDMGIDIPAFLRRQTSTS